MLFRRIDQTTINCIITREDLEKYGVRLDDILMRKTDSLRNLRDAIARAAVKENLNIDARYNSMQCAVLRDNTISLTLSQEKRSPADYMTKTGQELLKKAEQNWKEIAERGAAQRAALGNSSTVIYSFFAFVDAIDAAKALTDEEAELVNSSLYFDEGEEEYYLIADRKADGAKEDERSTDEICLRIHEFAEPLEENTASVAAYIKEHAYCILENDAVQTLRGI